MVSYLTQEVNSAEYRKEKRNMKDFGVKPWLFPMPTYMIGTYNEDESVDLMMMAWGGSALSAPIRCRTSLRTPACMPKRAAVWTRLSWPNIP